MKKAKILVVDDELSMRELLRIVFEADNYLVDDAASGEEALLKMQNTKFDLIISDLNMSKMSGLELLSIVKEISPDIAFVVVTAFGSTESAVEAMKCGAANYVLKPFNNDELRLVVKRALGMKILQLENRRLKGESQKLHFGRLMGSSHLMLEIYEMIRRVKDSMINCMILGESGTGKELVARSIHFSGLRASGPFVAINCGAIPEALVESELFGHRRGSFTGAVRDKMGLLQAAHKGTLFLDEVDSLPLSSQVKLLRALQDKKFTPVGGVRESSVDVRFIAASNCDLDSRVRDGAFREDLYYRLNVVQMLLPPLRDRGEDISELIDFFFEKYSGDYTKSIVGISPKARRMLMQWKYSGNVRELQNIIERAVALCPGNVIQAEDLPKGLGGAWSPKEALHPEKFPDEGVNLDEILATVEKKWLTAAINNAEGRKGKAAESLHMSFRSFRYRLSKYGMD